MTDPDEIVWPANFVKCGTRFDTKGGELLAERRERLSKENGRLAMNEIEDEK